MAEARRLWDLEADEPRITTVQAGIIFSVVHNLCGLDQVGQMYRIHAIRLAEQLKLFDAAPSDIDERQGRGRVYTAWMLFSWES